MRQACRSIYPYIICDVSLSIAHFGTDPQGWRAMAAKAAGLRESWLISAQFEFTASGVWMNATTR